MSDLIVTEVTEDPYTLIPNFIINDPGWSCETKMTWIFLFSKRHIPGWKVRPTYVQKMLGFGDRVWRRVSKDLVAMGYLTSTKTKDGTVIKFVYDWSFKEQSKKRWLQTG